MGSQPGIDRIINEAICYYNMRSFQQGSLVHNILIILTMEKKSSVVKNCWWQRATWWISSTHFHLFPWHLVALFFPSIFRIGLIPSIFLSLYSHDIRIPIVQFENKNLNRITETTMCNPVGLQCKCILNLDLWLCNAIGKKKKMRHVGSRDDSNSRNVQLHIQLTWTSAAELIQVHWGVSALEYDLLLVSWLFFFFSFSPLARNPWLYLTLIIRPGSTQPSLSSGYKSNWEEKKN